MPKPEPGNQGRLRGPSVYPCHVTHTRAHTHSHTHTHTHARLHLSSLTTIQWSCTCKHGAETWRPSTSTTPGFVPRVETDWMKAQQVNYCRTNYCCKIVTSATDPLDSLERPTGEWLFILLTAYRDAYYIHMCIYLPLRLVRLTVWSNAATV